MLSCPPIALSYAARREVIERVASDYRTSSLAQKMLLLDRVVEVTGYARKYAIRLLGEAAEGKRTIGRRRLPCYGSEVQQALLGAWKAAKQLCTKCLIPFLPTLVASLERHGHLHLSEERRGHLLAISAPTTDRMLRPHRKTAPRGLSTTQAGPLLKQQIPICTFYRWDKTQPGFLEGDLVAHSWTHRKGSYLYALILTGGTTGWTDYLPVLYYESGGGLACVPSGASALSFIASDDLMVSRNRV
ncbi:MAG TPA: hypothetical protein VGN34_21895, partial [Ktedonobacteraceae bacterium]